MTRTTSVSVPISPGELFDKLTILEIKAERIRDSGQRENVLYELSLMAAIADHDVVSSAALRGLAAELKQVNEALWQVEDELRACERRGDFGSCFVELARSVYRHNDHRARLKRRINDLLGSELIEEKSYEPYDDTADELPARGASAE